MVLRLDAASLIDRSRRRVQDEGKYAWTDDEILEAADDILNELTVAVQLAGRDHSLDKMDLFPADLTADGHMKWTYQLPAYVQAVRMVEGSREDGGLLEQIMYAELTHKEAGRQGGYQTVWSYDEGSHEGRIAFYGRPERFPKITLWFNRRYAPLQLGLAGAATSDSQVGLDLLESRVGPLSRIDGAYCGLEIAFLDGPAVGVPAKVTAYDGSTAIATVAPAWSAAPAPGDNYAFLVPLAPEHNEFLLQRIAHQLYLRSGNMEFVNVQQGYLSYLQSRFTAALDERITDQPKTFWSSRIRS